MKIQAYWTAVLIQAILFLSPGEWEEIVEEVQSGPPGLCVVLKDEEGERALELARETELLIYVQINGKEGVGRARRAARDAGFYGKRIYVEEGDPSSVAAGEKAREFAGEAVDQRSFSRKATASIVASLRAGSRDQLRPAAFARKPELFT